MDAVLQRCLLMWKKQLAWRTSTGILLTGSGQGKKGWNEGFHLSYHYRRGMKRKGVGEPICSVCKIYQDSGPLHTSSWLLQDLLHPDELCDFISIPRSPSLPAAQSS
jgi:hypothetical protein